MVFWFLNWFLVVIYKCSGNEAKKTWLFSSELAITEQQEIISPGIEIETTYRQSTQVSFTGSSTEAREGPTRQVHSLTPSAAETGWCTSKVKQIQTPYQVAPVCKLSDCTIRLFHKETLFVGEALLLYMRPSFSKNYGLSTSNASQKVVLRTSPTMILSNFVKH